MQLFSFIYDMKLCELLKIGQSRLEDCDNGTREAELFLEDILGISSMQYILDYSKEVDDNMIEKYLNAIDRRAQGIPYNYITGKKFFYDDFFYVNRHTLIPRSETEIMVDFVIDNYIGKTSNNFKYLDLCTGSGAIGISIAKKLKIVPTLTDISEDALLVAQENANNIGVKANFILSDIFNKVNDSFDLITANPPYIPVNRKDELSRELLYEPDLALYSGVDGLDIIKRIISNLQNHLSFHGLAIIEIDETHSNSITKFIDKNVFAYYFIKDLNNYNRFIVLERRPKCWKN